MNPIKKTPEERAQKPVWRVVHTFAIGGSDVRKIRIVQRVYSDGKGPFSMELGLPQRIGDELAWLPFEEKVFQDHIVRLVHKDLVIEIGRMAAERLDEAALVLDIAKTDELLASLELGQPVEVQLGGTCEGMKQTGSCEHWDHRWIPADFVRVEDRGGGWVRVKFSDQTVMDNELGDDTDWSLIMPGHVRRPPQ